MRPPADLDLHATPPDYPDWRRRLGVRRTLTVLALTPGWAAAGYAQAGADARPFTEGLAPAVIAPVRIHPPAGDLTCTQHAIHAGDPVFLGDAAGIDCIVVRRAGGPARFPRFHEQDGQANEDWYGWGAPVFAPFTGVVEEVHVNPVTNHPGAPGDGPASFMTFRAPDGTRVLYGHVTAPTVSSGDRVTAGQAVARIGNNGFAWYPHIHVGAWKGHDVLQVLLDPRSVGALEERQPH
jgi:murein DD-endopeptidase MepM/ murein hydrolase activator NlpD